jgi:hypothetical protein
VTGEFAVVIILLLKSLAKTMTAKATDTANEINQGDNLFIAPRSNKATLLAFFSVADEASRGIAPAGDVYCRRARNHNAVDRLG